MNCRVCIFIVRFLSLDLIFQEIEFRMQQYAIFVFVIYIYIDTCISMKDVRCEFHCACAHFYYARISSIPRKNIMSSSTAQNTWMRNRKHARPVLILLALQTSTYKRQAFNYHQQLFACKYTQTQTHRQRHFHTRLFFLWVVCGFIGKIVFGRRNRNRSRSRSQNQNRRE